jgi:quercetin dioxygenase-like cupin family protein
MDAAMQHPIFLSAALLLSSACLVCAQSPGVSYIPSDKVGVALAKGGQLVQQSDLLVSASHREKDGQVEVHDKETDIFYVVDGEATLVTGGKMLGSKNTKPGQYLGTGIEGGQTHQLKKGDVVVIPAGTPHWFKEVPKSVSYFVTKVLKP